VKHRDGISGYGGTKMWEIETQEYRGGRVITKNWVEKKTPYRICGK